MAPLCASFYKNQLYPDYSYRATWCSRTLCWTCHMFSKAFYRVLKRSFGNVQHHFLAMPRFVCVLFNLFWCGGLSVSSHGFLLVFWWGGPSEPRIGGSDSTSRPCGGLRWSLQSSVGWCQTRSCSVSCEFPCRYTRGSAVFASAHPSRHHSLL